MNANQLSAIAKRAGELASMGMNELRLTHPDNTEGTTSGAQWKSVSRAQLTADILFDEFADQCESE